MGDFNGRVGNQRTPWEAHLGPHSDHNTNRNYNGQLTLELCAQHGLFITNTFFQHRRSQIYTWYKWNNLEQASQINFILARKSHQRHVIDSKAMPNIQVDTDHRPVMLETRAPHQLRNSDIHYQLEETQRGRHLSRNRNGDGENLAEKCEKSPRELYKAVKAVRQRDEPFDPTSLINDEAGNPLTDQEDRNNRWEECFDGLLNFGDSQRSQEPFSPGFPDEEEPSILEDEVRAVVKESAKNKAAGTDDITTEAIQACGDVGIKWLTRVFNAAWEERAAPDDWQKAIVIPIWKKKGSNRDCEKDRASPC
ncbi:uncharacterized protein [Amphiura filiformis]|uniref:uncharacterized protein n=1 Tax=Amphiura filiformis TaxID=82378 RepID=UPI003B22346B